ncbi:Molybdopterin synthase catalytic subunit [Phytophthora cinnamomi]|uniref:Molybdopterin synthase catalytic subunit n=1 Tax=Phytophthora cinnamomi TaxID=4785 RepID=UPI00355986C4|nr:Molybdopterin synthase catalytic subunit [Phytophthora cinnamomi]
MTGTAQVATKSFRGIQPTPVGSPGATARKILQSRAPSKPHAGSNNNNNNNNSHELLPDEAQGLKDLLLSTPSHQQRSRFSFLKLKRVVVPPVQIPPELNTPNAISNIVAGSKIPMTKAMWMRRRARMMRRVPGRIDERVAW